ncbi:29928_t:CDS:2, partial [Gigaspora margarita]
EFINTLTEQKCLVLERDKIVVEYLDIAYLETVWLIRRFSEKVEWLKLKIGKHVNREASIENIQETPDEKECKEVLLLTEYGVFNYEWAKEGILYSQEWWKKDSQIESSKAKETKVHEKEKYLKEGKKSNSNSFQKNNRRMHISSPKSIHEETSGFVLREILQRLDDIERRYIGAT